MADQNLQPIRVGTRESKLAMLQTQMVVDALTSVIPDIKCDITPITTRGDKILDRPLADLGSRGVFVKELEEALLANEVDLVVHSLKDLPTDLPPGLTLAAVLERDDPRDVLVSKDNLPFDKLPAGARVATSSRRRAAQLRSLRSDLAFVDIRGNIPTRLHKHDEGQCDAMVLAAAGLLRLGLADRIAQYLDPAMSMPAVGQGALAVECRDGDSRVLDLIRRIDDPGVRAEVTAERAFLDRLGGGCSVPVGALCQSLPDGRLRLSGCVAALDGSLVLRQSLDGTAAEAADLGNRLAAKMMDGGAGDILEGLKKVAPQAVSPP